MGTEMNSKHKELVEKARKAIQDVFGDQSVSQSETLSSLEGLQADIDAMVMTLGGYEEAERDDDDDSL